MRKPPLWSRSSTFTLGTKLFCNIEHPPETNVYFKTILKARMYKRISSLLGTPASIKLDVTPQTPQSWFSAAIQPWSCEKGRRRPRANIFGDEALLFVEVDTFLAEIRQIQTCWLTDGRQNLKILFWRFLSRTYFWPQNEGGLHKQFPGIQCNFRHNVGTHTLRRL